MNDLLESLGFKTAQLSRLIDGLSGAADYQPELANPAFAMNPDNENPMMANPRTKEDYAKDLLVQLVRNTVLKHEERLMRSARQAKAATELRV